ncbi:MAG: hypothetical protein IT219_09995 [Bacteroidales bacterium]|jgi:hypothetical protein|nr:hypothetical protein [Bacteroidales bacterium]
MEKADRKKERQENINLALQSLSIFLISYYLLYFISGLSVLYIAYDLDIPARLFINKMVFYLPDDGALWTSDAVISILMATPVSSFITGIIVLFIFFVVARKNAVMLSFSLWLFLQAFNMTFGLLSENILSQTGLVRVANVMGLEQIMLILTVGVSFFFLIKSGMLAGKLFFGHLENIELMTSRQKMIKAVYFFIFPWLIGSSIVILLSWQTAEKKDFILSAFMLFLLIPALLTPLPPQRTPLHFSQKITPWIFLFAIVVSLFTLLLLRHGISFSTITTVN